MNKASEYARRDILNMIDEGAPLAPRAYTQPPSAVEVMTEVELLNQLQQSRVHSLEMFLSQLCRMMIDQFRIVSSEGTVAIGKRGKKKQFSVAQLKDPEKYDVTCKLMPENKRIAIVNESRALAMWGRAPLKYILRDILQAEDPDGWMRELDLEEAKRADPALALFEMGVRYVEEAEDIENADDAELKKFQSMMLIERGISMVKARMQPAPMSKEVREPKLEQEKGNMQGLISALGAGGQGGVSRPKMPQEIIE